MNCFFVTDLHGKTSRYEALINEIKKELPNVVLMGGDLLPGFSTLYSDFITEYFIPKFEELSLATYRPCRIGATRRLE